MNTSNVFVKILDGFLWMFLVFISFLFLTGGGILSTQYGKIEFSSLDPWCLCFYLLLLLRTFFFPKCSVPLLTWARKQITWIMVPNRSVWAMGWLFLFVFGSLLIAHLFRFLSFKTFAYDLTFLHQSLFWPWGNPILKCDLCLGGTYLGDHLSYSLLLISVFTQFFHSDFLIFALEILLIAVPIWAGFRFGPLRDKKETWFLIALVFLSERALRNSLVWDFREDHLTFAFLVGLLIALYRGKQMLAVLFFLATLLAKEHLSLILPFLAIPILKSQDLPLSSPARRWMAALMVSGSLIWAWISFGVLIPELNQGQETFNNIVVRFPGMGSSPKEILLHLLKNPEILIGLLKTKILQWKTWKYVILLLGPVLFWIRWKAIWLIPALPGILMNILPQHSEQTAMTFHYDLVILPFLFFALLLGCAQELPRMNPSRWAVVLLLALLFSGRWPMLDVRKFWPSWDSIQNAQYLDQIPNDGVVAANLWALAHLSHLKELRAFSLVDEIELQESDRTGIPKHGARFANRFVLDLTNPSEKEFALKLHTQGWEKVSQSSSGQWIYLKKPVAKY